MTRQERVGLHKKQERLQIQTGVPQGDELAERVPQLRNVEGKGIVEYIKHKGVLFNTSLKRKSKDIIKITDSTTGTENGNIINASSGDAAHLDDIATLAAKINEIITKIN